MWWDSFTFPEGQWYCWSLSGAEIFICRKDRNWQSFHKSIRWDKRGFSCTGPVEATPDYRGNVRTNIINRKTAALWPYLPKKPFLLNLSGLKIFPGMKITLDLVLPPLLRLVAKKSKGDPDLIFDFNLFELKESWYGKTPIEGIVCSLLPFNAHGKTCEIETDSPGDDPTPGRIGVNCSMQVCNKTKTVLELDNIPFYANELNVYEKDGKLTCDTPVVDALENGFHMTVIPAKSEYGNLLTHGYKHESGFIHQGTWFIKNITGL